MATKFSTIVTSNQASKSYKTTILKFTVLGNKLYESLTTVDTCTEVIYLGFDANAGKDAFLCLLPTGARSVYYGTKGDEFD